ncbi:MAG: 3-hydroxyacyl-CoA dehydrogenase NAD-binding domain-containing protein, partial [Acidobacteria bacterium]|nr:3-hydroxyacyl-CoA dehydrogenase NAD-binding domain-containing protein [Acidobacteriota bacterium]
MGSRIAAHLANAGLAVVLLDIPSGEGGARSAIALRAVEEMKRAKPAAFFEPSLAGRITVGNFEDDLVLLHDCDWIIEAVTEDLAIKQALLA